MVKMCCVVGCEFTPGKALFRFPKPTSNKQRFLTWLTASGNSKLLNIPAEKVPHRFVCIDHFEKRYMLYKKLSHTAVPTLNLPKPIDISNYSMDGIISNNHEGHHISDTCTVISTGEDSTKSKIIDCNLEINNSQPSNIVLTEQDQLIKSLDETGISLDIPVACYESDLDHKNQSMAFCEVVRNSNAETYVFSQQKRSKRGILAKKKCYML